MKVVERVLEKRLCRIVSVDEMQFGFMLKIRSIDVVFILRMMQEEYHAKGKKSCICVLRTKRKPLTEYHGSVGMGVEEERNTGSIG